MNEPTRRRAPRRDPGPPPGAASHTQHYAAQRQQFRQQAPAKPRSAWAGTRCSVWRWPDCWPPAWPGRGYGGRIGAGGRERARGNASRYLRVSYRYRNALSAGVSIPPVARRGGGGLPEHLQQRGQKRSLGLDGLAYSQYQAVGLSLEGEGVAKLARLRQPWPSHFFWSFIGFVPM